MTHMERRGCLTGLSALAIAAGYLLGKMMGVWG